MAECPHAAENFFLPLLFEPDSRFADLSHHLHVFKLYGVLDL